MGSWPCLNRGARNWREVTDSRKGAAGEKPTLPPFRRQEVVQFPGVGRTLEKVGKHKLAGLHELSELEKVGPKEEAA